MLPLSRKKRSFYLVFFSIVFVAATIYLISYATGYRLTSRLDFAHTGGFYVSSALSGSDIYVAGKFITKTSLFQRSSLVQNLKPGSYELSVSKDGYQTWKKTLLVFPEKITEAHPFTIKESPILTEIFPYVAPVAVASSTETLQVGTTTKIGKFTNEFLSTRALFATSTPNAVVTATSTSITLRKLRVSNVSGKLHAQWVGDAEDEPYYFCQNDVCQSEIAVSTGAPVATFDFFPGRDDLLVVSLPTGLFVVEIDARSTSNIQKLTDGKNLDFRIDSQGIIFVKKGQAFYSISL